MTIAHPASELANKLRSAARTGRKLHLEPSHVAVLMSASIYQAISAIEAEEIRRTCAVDQTNDNSVETFGSGNGQTTGSGVSVGSNIVPLNVASRGARSRLTEAMLDLQLQKKQSMP